MKKWIAYDASAGEHEYFETYGEAKKWLIEVADFSEGYPDEYISGESYIAKITHITEYKEADNINSYRCLMNPDRTANCGNYADCPEECNGTSMWPHSINHHSVGKIGLKKLEEDIEVMEQVTDKIESDDDVDDGLDDWDDSGRKGG